jgi:hypothetical protein
LALVDIVVSFVAMVLAVVQPFVLYDEAFRSAQKAYYNYVWTVAGGSVTLLFCLQSFLFLKRIQASKISDRARRVLQKITWVGIGNFFAEACFLFTGTLNLQAGGGGNNITRYIVTFVLEMVAWIIYHTLIFYFLSIRPPKRRDLELVRFTVPDDYQSSDNLTIALSSTSEESQGQQLRTDPQARWNAIVLQGMAKGSTKPLLPQPEETSGQSGSLGRSTDVATFGNQQSL